MNESKCDIFDIITNDLSIRQDVDATTAIRQDVDATTAIRQDVDATTAIRQDVDATTAIRQDVDAPNNEMPHLTTLTKNDTQAEVISDDIGIKLFFDDEYVMYITHMSLKHELFDNMLTTRLQQQSCVYKFTEDEFLIGRQSMDGSAPFVIMQARWHFIGQYGYADNYWWRWAWDILPLSKIDNLNNQAAELAHLVIPSNGYSAIQKVLTKLSDTLASLKSAFLSFKDPTLISFLQGFMCEHVPYEYMKAIEIAPDIYTLIGLFAVKWPIEKIEPFYSVEPSLSEEAQESLALLKGILKNKLENPVIPNNTNIDKNVSIDNIDVDAGKGADLQSDRQ